MDLTIARNIAIPTIERLHHLAMRHIFEKINDYEAYELNMGIEEWSKMNLDEQNRWELQRIVNALIADENGYFYRSKELQKQHKIDWRKMYKAGLPFIRIEGRTSFARG